MKNHHFVSDQHTLVDQWIDIHAHFYPPENIQEREQRWLLMKEAAWLTPAPPVWDPESTLAYMDRTGIAMQMLSNVPKTIDKLRRSNDYGALLTRQYPTRFGLLAALPTDDPEACLLEIERAYTELHADGFAVTCNYNGVYLSDPSLDPVWAELDRRKAVIFVHPDAYAPASMGRPCVVVEVAFETARTVVDMLYAGVFRRFPDMKIVLAHCGGALPVLSGRLCLLGDAQWLPNPNQVSAAEIKEHLRRLYVDTAATSPTGFGPALEMTTADHIIYGSDCGVPCSTDETMNANIRAILSYTGLSAEQIENIGHNALQLFPAAAERMNSTK